MKFCKYPEIENHYREKYIKILKEHGFYNIPYIVHEKIHGANFSFWCDGAEVKVASRQQFVDNGFYNCYEVLERYKDAILNLYIEEFDGESQIAVYGELFGPSIQKGIYYGERKDFMAFEIRVNEHQIVDPIHTKLLFANYDIPQVPFVGLFATLGEALEVSNEFDSKVINMIPEEYKNGLNKFLQDGDNKAEGLVIQPADEALRTGNGARVMIKSKGERWKEKASKRKRGDREPGPINPYIEIAEMYVNENRLNAVTSKFGVVTQKDFGKIIGLMNKDVIKDMIKDGDLPTNWKKHEVYKDAGKGVSIAVSTFLKENLLKEL